MSRLLQSHVREYRNNVAQATKVGVQEDSTYGLSSKLSLEFLGDQA